MEDDYPKHFRSGQNSHTSKCASASCTNKKREGHTYCRSCMDKHEFRETFEKIEKLKSDITEQRKIIIINTETETRLEEQIINIKILISNTKLELERSEFELKQLFEQQTRLEKRNKDIQTLIRKTKLELKKSENDLQEKTESIKLSSETVSDDSRVHVGTNKNGNTVLLETHCTIVRLLDSQENVYFGHVTLVITDETENRWHYGIFVSSEKKKLPRKLEHEFWNSKHNTHTKVPESTFVKEFGDFKTITDDIKLSDMMKRHFDRCFTFFNRAQWPNQVWNKDDRIGSESAVQLVNRLRKQKQDIEKKKSDFSYQSYKEQKQIDEELQQEKVLIEQRRAIKHEQRRKENEFRQIMRAQLDLELAKQELAQPANLAKDLPNLKRKPAPAQKKDKETERTKQESLKKEREEQSKKDKDKERERQRQQELEQQKLEKEIQEKLEQQQHKTPKKKRKNYKKITLHANAVEDQVFIDSMKDDIFITIEFFIEEMPMLLIAEKEAEYRVDDDEDVFRSRFSYNKLQGKYNEYLEKINDYIYKLEKNTELFDYRNTDEFVMLIRTKKYILNSINRIVSYKKDIEVISANIMISKLTKELDKRKREEQEITSVKISDDYKVVEKYKVSILTLLDNYNQDLDEIDYYINELEKYDEELLGTLHNIKNYIIQSIHRLDDYYKRITYEHATNFYKKLIGYLSSVHIEEAEKLENLSSSSEDSKRYILELLAKNSNILDEIIYHIEELKEVNLNKQSLYKLLRTNESKLLKNKKILEDKLTMFEAKIIFIRDVKSIVDEINKKEETLNSLDTYSEEAHKLRHQLVHNYSQYNNAYVLFMNELNNKVQEEYIIDLRNQALYLNEQLKSYDRMTEIIKIEGHYIRKLYEKFSDEQNEDDDVIVMNLIYLQPSSSNKARDIVRQLKNLKSQNQQKGKKGKKGKDIFFSTKDIISAIDNKLI